MAIAESKLTSQGQISVPAKIRKKLGLTPGAVLEWHENAQGEITIKRAHKFSSLDIHKALFKTPPEAKSLEAINEGIKQYIKQKYAGN